MWLVRMYISPPRGPTGHSVLKLRPRRIPVTGRVRAHPLTSVVLLSETDSTISIAAPGPSTWGAHLSSIDRLVPVWLLEVEVPLNEPGRSRPCATRGLSWSRTWPSCGATQREPSHASHATALTGEPLDPGTGSGRAENFTRRPTRSSSRARPSMMYTLFWRQMVCAGQCGPGVLLSYHL